MIDPQPIDHSMIKAVPDLYLILDTSYTIIEASETYLNATNLERAELIGKKIFTVFAKKPRILSPQGIKNLKASVEKVIQTKAPNTMPIQKYNIPRSNNIEHYWSTLNTPVLNKNNEITYIIHRIEDRTELVHLKQSGLANSQRLKLLLENIIDYAIIMLDEKGYITTWNLGAIHIIGYKADEIIGKHFSIFYTNEAKSNHHPEHELEIAQQVGRYEEEGWRIRKNGSKFWASVIITPIYDNTGHLIGYGKVSRDLTEQKKIEALKNEFVSIVNHELRTPLTSIFGAIRLLLNEVNDYSTKVKQLLNIANANCDRLMKLINDMLDIEKIEVGKMKFNFQYCELDHLIANAIAINEIYAERMGIKISAALTPHVHVNVDADRLVQVLTNLISNAVKFSSLGSEVKINLTCHKKVARVSVINQGEGIPDSFKDKIFEKFSQADVSAKRESGTGLGLAISKAILERFGSTLQFYSELNKETVFYFELAIITRINDDTNINQNSVC